MPVTLACLFYASRVRALGSPLLLARAGPFANASLDPHQRRGGYPPLNLAQDLKSWRQ
ncbi:protein of unknown function [Methylorubrum extorquens]|uniref:Uncharacterized protein n=1 Tax=Methylorubrum extorquens TaxID=408 RepID=A0A2N9AMW3_METEX|nr:protein of unknown function [Methylorubrum extorquens]